ncbi:hypothetical protein Y032_0045g1092 [Ancylostoma ceylanicum]|uniref:Uncharacterized protein n=1 Tax=Ancylostoma ceylanicum TaxID=53326 RepID=A0A016UCY4_9BILA|nr:hypothetical protein Y032_0045g1092 [Ancylostoma ceylanicum]
MWKPEHFSIRASLSSDSSDSRLSLKAFAGTLESQSSPDRFIPMKTFFYNININFMAQQKSEADSISRNKIRRIISRIYGSIIHFKPYLL